MFNQHKISDIAEHVGGSILFAVRKFVTSFESIQPSVIMHKACSLSCYIFQTVLYFPSCFIWHPVPYCIMENVALLLSLIYSHIIYVIVISQAGVGYHCYYTRPKAKPKVEY